MANVIIFILSCKKNKPKVENLKPLWLDSCGYPYVIVNGDSEIQQPFILNKKTRELIVKCPDNYDSLSLKVLLGFKAISEIYKPLGIMKIDDDILIRVPKLQYFIQNLKKNPIDYAGNVTHDINRWSLYHQGKCESQELNEKPQFLPNIPYCRGGVYYVSQKSIQVLIKNIKPENHLYEDVLIGSTLYNAKIEPKNFAFMTDILQEYIDNPEIIGLHDPGYNYDFNQIKKQYIDSNSLLVVWIILIILLVLILFYDQ
jgi:hypothetical protein